VFFEQGVINIINPDGFNNFAAFVHR
jgi:hypothetical protein